MSKVIARVNEIPVSEKEFQSLDDGHMLFDNVINAFLSFLRTDEIAVFPTYFFSVLQNEKRSFRSPNSWAAEENLENARLCLVPLHNGENPGHWALAVFYVQSSVVVIFDSIYSEWGCLFQENDFERLRIWANQAGESLNLESWPSQWVIQQGFYSPQQDNNADCGVFTCMNAYFVARDWEVSYTTEHISGFRRAIAWSISQEEIYDIPEPATEEWGYYR